MAALGEVNSDFVNKITAMIHEAVLRREESKSYGHLKVKLLIEAGSITRVIVDDRTSALNEKAKKSKKN